MEGWSSVPGRGNSRCGCLEAGATGKLKHSAMAAERYTLIGGLRAQMAGAKSCRSGENILG